MTERRRKDKAHDIGDSMPGTVGDSSGTIHDQFEGPSINPEDDVHVPAESNTQSTRQSKKPENPQSNKNTEDSEGESTRMKYAKRHGDSWPEDRQRRFLREHNVSARKMGWKLTE